MKTPLFTAFILTILSTGCTTFTFEECRDMDWHRKGAELAMTGQTQNRARDFVKRECLDNFGIAPNFESLFSGYNAGLKQFCTPEFSRAFAEGGGVYEGTCPESTEEKVLPHYSSGRINFLERTVGLLKAKVNGLESEVSKLKSEKSDLEAKVRASH